MKIYPYKPWFWLLLAFQLFSFSAFSQGRYNVQTLFTEQSLPFLNPTNGGATNIPISMSPVVLSAGQSGKLSWLATPTNGVPTSNIVSTAVFAQELSGPYVSPQFVTNAFPGGGAGTNTLQVITVPDQMRFMKVTNVTYNVTNSGALTIKIGQFW